MGAKSPSKPKADDPAQYKRFVEAAREAKADETEGGADRAFKKVISKVPPKTANRARSGQSR
jgi:hypothetical protein